MSEQPNPRPDIGIDRRKVLVGGALTLAAGAAWSRMPQSHIGRVDTKEFEGLVPETVGAWQFVTRSGVVLPPPDAFSDRLYDNLVSRVYSDPNGNLLMLLIAYNNRQDGVLQIHRPEICYPAGGFVLSPTAETAIPLNNGQSIPAQTFQATNRDRFETVLYWTRVGKDFPRRWAEQRRSVIGANLAGEIPDGLLFRVSTLGNPGSAALEPLKRFAADFVAAAPSRLAGILAWPKISRVPPPSSPQET